MKILTKEEERAHYNETLKGGTIGGFAGLGVGVLGVWAASRRYHFFRTLTLPLKAFLVTSSGTFSGIIAADHWSRQYEKERNPADREYAEREKERKEAAVAGKTFTERAMEFGRQERYKIVGGSWIASMVAAFSLVNRNKYLSGQQKIVQARVYAQFLTLGVLVASAAFEISDQRNQQGRYETVKYIDPDDPEHKRVLEKQVEVEMGGVGGEKEDRGGRDLWKDMVQAEEQRIKEREDDEKRWRKQSDKKHNGKKHKKDGDGKGGEGKDDGKDDGKDKKDDGKDKKGGESKGGEGKGESKDDGKDKKDKKDKKEEK